MSPPASKYSMAACPMASVPANPTAPLMAQPSTGTTPTAVRAMLRNRNAPPTTAASSLMRSADSGWP